MHFGEVMMSEPRSFLSFDLFMEIQTGKSQFYSYTHMWRLLKLEGCRIF